MLVLILFGPPGSGKGTQANTILQNYPNSIYISTGDILRENIKKNTELGKLAENYISKGLLVPDEVINSMIQNKFQEINNSNHSKNNKLLILDGYPRSINQLKFLLNLVPINCIKSVYLKLNLEEVIKRIVYRRICLKCNRIYHLIYNKPKNNETCDICNEKLHQRSDDKEEIVINRYNVYMNSTLPILQEFKENNISFLEIDANQEVEKISQTILNYLKSTTF
ncbi:MAG: nucleoside monophosphate kinase [bacterium]|nr:nucleoside monophosphate kinase [bacterium]